MIPAGSAITAIPKNDEIIVITLPVVVTGYISPYPTVVSDTVAQYKASKKLSKESGSIVKIIRADTRIYVIAIAQTASKESLDFLITVTIISKFLEYRNALNTLKTRNALANLNNLKSLKPLLIRIKDGRIETRSIMAIGENGYLMNDKADLL